MEKFTVVLTEDQLEAVRHFAESRAHKAQTKALRDDKPKDYRTFWRSREQWWDELVDAVYDTTEEVIS